MRGKQNAAVHRPDRFDLFAGPVELDRGSSAKTPSQLAGRGLQAVDPSVRAAEEDASVEERWGRIDPPPGHELPRPTTAGRIEGMHGV